MHVNVFSQEKKEGEDSDEEGKEGAAAADKPALDSDEDSESDEEEVVNITMISLDNGCLLQHEQELVVSEESECREKFPALLLTSELFEFLISHR